MIWVFLVCCIPTAWELYGDRNGETKKDKRKDLIISIFLYLILALAVLWLFDLHIIRPLALMFGIRVLCFDYLIHYILIKRGIIHGHWFTYSGKTATFDRLISRMNPWLVLACRVLVFGASLATLWAWL